MKKLLNLIISITIVIATAFSLTACDLLDMILGGDSDLSYSKESASTERVSEIRSYISSNTLSNGSYLKYEASYDYDYSHSGSNYVYEKEYEVDMKVNGEAQVGEVFAYIELKSVYSQPDGKFGRDVLVKYCIKRVTSGSTYNDYKVYMNVNGQTSSATFYQMIDLIEELEVYNPGDTSNYYMLDALDYQDNQGAYFETLYAYAEAVTGNEVVSTLDNPIMRCLHYFNKDSFIDNLYEVTGSSKNTYSLYSKDGNSFKIKRNYTDSRYFFEKDVFTETLTINEDGTYTYKYDGEYETQNPARAFESSTEQELKPLYTAIQAPSWVN